MMARVLAVALLVALSPAAAAYDGVFALSGGEQKTQGHLRITPAPQSPSLRHLDVWLTRDRSQTIETYEVDLTKRLHLIAISDDFKVFIHVHPVLASDHHFLIDTRFPGPGVYHIYADCDPAGIGQQVFRFDVPLGPAAAAKRDLSPTGRRVQTGPYAVSLATTRLRTRVATAVAVHITRDGRPAGDLHPYLGALAHAVFISATDLSYAHVHPLALTAGGGAGMAGMSSMPGMSGMSDTNMPALGDNATSSPDMLLHVRVETAGTYKLWLQFRAADGLHVAPFVLTAT